MRPSEAYDDFGGRAVLRWIFWAGVFGMSAVMWGVLALIAAFLCSVALDLLTVPV